MRVGPWSNGVSLLINEDEIPELSPSPSAFVHRKVHVTTQQEGGLQQAKKIALTRNQIRQNLEPPEL